MCIMIVQPGGKVGLELCDSESFNLKVTPPKTGVTVNERPLGKWHVLYRMVTGQLGSLSSRRKRVALDWEGRSVDTQDRFALPFLLCPSLARGIEPRCTNGLSKLQTTVASVSEGWKTVDGPKFANKRGARREWTGLRG